MLSPKSPTAVSPLDTSPFPLSLDLVKAHLREDSDDFDTIIELYSRAAIEWAEGATKRTIYSRSHMWILGDFPRDVCGEIWLPRGKCSAVESIVYRDSLGAAQTLHGPTSSVSPAGDDWQENLTGDAGGFLYPPLGGVWPSANVYAAAPVTITFTAGWASADVPADITHALLFAVADMYDTAGSADLTVFGKNLTTRNSLISPYILNRWF
ncbi:MAG TPA: phage head-tail connector protein [Candidatus Saccharimonadia bacterium]|nr:phage head-tail connector protein [Candidatus Saccharimonadia bacterium]